MLNSAGVQLAGYISQQRLMDKLAQLARFGALEHGGVNRQALSSEELDARAWLIDWAYTLGCEVMTDDGANLFIRRAGREDLPPVVTGSHIDTQPCGGNLDGCYGVIAGMECLSALAQAGISTLRPIEVAVWMNEEGSRFSPGAMGSSVFVQPQRLTGYLHHQDANGVTLAQALAGCHQRFPQLPRRATVPMAAFIELHIEQGPVLEQANQPLAVVQGIQGVRWYQVTCLGQSAHAGTTPMAARQDAMSLARQTAHQLEQLTAILPADQLRLTFGRWEIEPNAINTIAGRATFTLDFRHADPVVLAQFDDWMQQISARNVVVECLFSHEPVAFNRELLAQQYACAQALQIETATLTSGAFHDAMHLASHCPTSMFFVPSHNGISHNPAEYTDPQYLYLGAKALACCLTELANQPIGVTMSTHTYPACCEKDNGSALGTNATLSSPISADGTPVLGEVYTVPARCGRAVRLSKGQVIRITNTHGSQVCDTWLFNSADLSEFSSMEHTRAFIDKIIPQPGDALVTNQRRAIGTLLTDTSPGVHDTLIAACDLYRYSNMGITEYHDSCADNMRLALNAIGLRAKEVPQPLNLWMNTPVNPDYTISWLPTVSKAGDYVEIRAELDSIVVMSACPQDIVPINGCNPQDVHFTVTE